MNLTMTEYLLASHIEKDKCSAVLRMVYVFWLSNNTLVIKYRIFLLIFSFYLSFFGNNINNNLSV